MPDSFYQNSGSPNPPAESARMLIEHREEERRALARRLHDGIGQMLMVLRQHLALLQRNEPGLVDALSPSFALVDSMIQDVRAMSNQLWPVELELMGFPQALAACCQDVSANSLLQVHFHGQAEAANLPIFLQMFWFRLVQESLNLFAGLEMILEVQVSLQTTSGGTSLLITSSPVANPQAQRKILQDFHQPPDNHLELQIQALGGRLDTAVQVDDSIRISATIATIEPAQPPASRG